MWVADCTAPTIASLVESILKLNSSLLQDGGWFFMTNLANIQEHVSEAEHNNHVLKEHIHATYHGIHYKMLPRTVIC